MHVRTIRYESGQNFPSSGSMREHGIGRALAMRLADHGSTVLASARDASKLAELRQIERPRRAHHCPAPDVTDNDGVRDAYERIFAQRGARSLRSQRRDISYGWGHFPPTLSPGKSTLTGWVSSACLTHHSQYGVP